MENFSGFNLDKNILKSLEEIGYKQPTEIQRLAIPKALEGLDLIASAQTGTGKTAAFMLPALHRIVSKAGQPGRGPQMLVLVPTRELAMQVASEAQKYTKYFPQIKCVCIYGGAPYPPQRRALSRPYEILVATPGRLIDHMEQGLIRFPRLKVLVLDEADRMLDMGFVQPVEKIAAVTPKDRQTFLFSATLDSKILKFSKKLQNQPFEIRVTPTQTTRNNIEQRLYYADNMGHKMRMLDHLLGQKEIHQAIVFTATKRQADEIARRLRDKGEHAGSLHGDMTQRQRTRTIGELRKGAIRVLVATDVAARGIDVAALTHIINIDLPYQPEDYIHRIGRTGRAGAKGIAITFATRKEGQQLSRINRMLGSSITVHTIEGLLPAATHSRPDESDRNRGRRLSKRPPWKNRARSGRWRART